MAFNDMVLAISTSRFQGLSTKQVAIIRDMMEDVETQLAEWRRVLGAT